MAHTNFQINYSGPTHSINEHQLHHDFIELSPRTQVRIFEKCALLYREGLSLRDIEERTGISKSTIRETLQKKGMALRNFSNGNNHKSDHKQSKLCGTTSYGYAYLDGQLVIDPREHLIVRKIMKQSWHLQLLPVEICLRFYFKLERLKYNL